MVNKVSWKARESVKCRHCRRWHYFMSVHLLQCFADSSSSLNIFNLQLVQFIDMETMQMERRFCSAQQIHMHDLQSSPLPIHFPKRKAYIWISKDGHKSIQNNIISKCQAHFVCISEMLFILICCVYCEHCLCLVCGPGWSPQACDALASSVFPVLGYRHGPPCLVLIMTCKCPIILYG